MCEKKPFLKKGCGKLSSQYHGHTTFARQRQQKILEENNQNTTYDNVQLKQRLHSHLECETYIRYKKPKQRHINRQLVQKSFEKTKHYAKTRSLLYKQRYTNTKISSEETKLLHYLEASLKKEIL